MPEYLAEAGDVFTGEVIFRKDGSIILQYLGFGTGFDKENCTIGIEDESGFTGLEVVYAGSYLHDSLCVVVSPLAVGWLSATPSEGVVAVDGVDTVTMTFESAGLGTGVLGAEVRIQSNVPDDDLLTFLATLTVERDFMIGDADGDADVDVDDIVSLITFIFSDGPEPNPMESGDADCSGQVDIDDAVYLVMYIFAGGPMPCSD
jgi:hypothetical protein